ncbi:transposon Tf2-11 type 1 [Puccinia sorghi]|uniref:Transposon Tf2-11 type 1 n=1 Tax=Puccinia sorghi TaxID=27349 RepID=A0A0L6VFS4_9BASI|nr:transposon Tf2-11 type 1 [Puccinia sorghi]
MHPNLLTFLLDHRVIAYCSNLPLPTFFEEKAEPSISGFFYSMISHPPLTAIPSLEDDEDIEDLETIRKILLPVYHDYADVFSPVQADKLPPHWPYNHQIELTGPAPLNTVSPVLFLPKNYERMLTLPPILHLLTLFHGATLFSKLDLQVACNLIQISKCQEWLTEMRSQFGSFEKWSVCQTLKVRILPFFSLKKP